MDTIRIVDLEVSYHVGVPDSERATAQRLLVSLDLEHDFRAAAAADDLNRTIDYYAVSRRVLAFGEGRSWRLIEKLADDIVRHGAVISEAPPLMEAFAGAFPQRNRIVSGMTLGTVVVQASERSGALITARLAGEQGREVFAVPGPIDCRMSRGCHELIRDGAKLVGNVDDILEELGPLFETTTTAGGHAVNTPAELQLGDLERRVFQAVGGGAIGIDDIVDAVDLAASQVLAAISVLETRRLVRRLPGSRIERI